jgi:hypothetical protein
MLDASSWMYNPFWGSFWGNLIIELIGGIIGGFLFLFIILIALRPSLKISSLIAKQQNNLDNEADCFYVFKIINTSFFEAFQVSLELYQLEFYPTSPNGTHIRFLPLTMKKSHLKQIPRWRRTTEKSRFANHCFLFRTNENLDAILLDRSKAVQLQVTLNHGLTGLTRVFSKTFKARNIKMGEFEFGNNTEVV